MPRVTVCSGFHPAGLELYGRRFVETFDKHWPKNIRLLVYTEQRAGVAKPTARRTIIERSLSQCDGVQAFIDRHKDIAEHCGRKAVPRWKAKEQAAGYSFRFDAVKFCKQLFIPEHAGADLPDGDILAWSDADVVSFADVPDGFVEGLLAGADLAFLGRGEKHSEIGFWAIRLGSGNGTRPFLRTLADMYRHDFVFDLPEWHSAYVFDACRREFEKHGGKSRDLTPGGRGHVWFQSPLCQYTDHLKGDRKVAGRSKERA